MEDDDWQNIKMKAISIIRLCIVDNVLFNIMDENLTPVL